MSAAGLTMAAEAPPPDQAGGQPGPAPDAATTEVMRVQLDGFEGPTKLSPARQANPGHRQRPHLMQSPASNMELFDEQRVLWR